MAWMSTGQGPLFWCECQDLPTCVYPNKNLPYSSRQRNCGKSRGILVMPEWKIYEHRLNWRIGNNFDLEGNMDFVDHPGPVRLNSVTLKCYSRNNCTFSERGWKFAIWKLRNLMPCRFYSLGYRLASDGEDKKRYSTRAYQSQGSLQGGISIYLRYIWTISICNDCHKFTSDRHLMIAVSKQLPQRYITTCF